MQDALPDVAALQTKVPQTNVLRATAELATATKITSFAYTAFGEQLGNAKVSGFGYNGEGFDAASGLLNLRKRQYEPTLHRFSNKDVLRGSILLPASLNRYIYVQNSPLNYGDFSGMSMAQLNIYQKALAKLYSQNPGKETTQTRYYEDLIRKEAKTTIGQLISSAHRAAENQKLSSLLSAIRDLSGLEKYMSVDAKMDYKNLQAEANRLKNKPSLTDGDWENLKGLCDKLYQSNALEKHPSVTHYRLQNLESLLLSGMHIDEIIWRGLYSEAELLAYLNWSTNLNDWQKKEVAAIITKETAAFNGMYDEFYKWKQENNQGFQEALGAVALLLSSFTPFDEFIDAVQVADGLVKGDYVGAAIDGIGFIPFLELGKYADDLIAALRKGNKTLKLVDANGVERLIKSADDLRDAVRDTGNAVEAVSQGNKIADRIFDHVFKQHKPSAYAKQLEFKPLDAALKELEGKSFFSALWSEQEIKEAIQHGFGEAIEKGIKNGQYSFEYLDDTITVALKNGELQTSWGSLKYSYEQLLEFIK